MVLSMRPVAPFLYSFINICMAFGFFAVIALLPLPGWLGAAVRYGFGFWLLGFGVILFFAYKTGRSWLVAIPLLFICALSLSGLWTNASNEMQVLGGFLYFSDAAQYYADAVRLLEGLPFSAFSARHPLPTLFFGFLLWLMNGELQWALIILAVIGALSILIAANSLARAEGYLAASVLAVTLFLFYRRFTGLPNSEQLGLAFGCLSLAFMLHAAVKGNPKAGLVGLFLLGLGIAARPGAFLILFTTLLWLTNWVPIFHGKYLVNLCVGLVVLSMGVSLTFLCNFLLAESGTTAFSNYSYSLYGITRGGLGWELFSFEHPETLSLPSSQAEMIAFRESILVIKANPMLGLHGWLDSFLEYFAIGTNSIYGFVAGGETASFGNPESRSLRWVYLIIRLLFYLFSIVGIMTLWRGRANSVHSLLLWTALGAFIGLAFIPARDAGMMRIHAVSLPYLLCLPAKGLTSVFRGEAKLAPGFTDQRLRELLALVLVLSILVGLVLPFGHSSLPTGSKAMTNCDVDEVSMDIKINRGDHFHVLDDEWTGDAPFPNLRYSMFQERIRQFHQSAQVNDLIQIQPDKIFMIAVDIQTGQSAWLILPTTTEQLAGSTLRVCGEWNSGLLANGLGFLEAGSIYPFTSQ
jgi:hypothetical protein